MISTSHTDALAQALDEAIPDTVVLGELSMVLEAAHEDGRAIRLTDGEAVHVPANADTVITTKAIFCERHERAFPSGYCFQVAIGGFIQGEGFSSAGICFARIFFDRGGKRIRQEFYRAMR
jgi:hypothetical protein